MEYILVLVFECSVYHVVMLSHIQLFAAPWTVDHQAPLYMRFPRQEYWSGFPFPLPGDLCNTGIKPTFVVLEGRFFTTL